MFLTDLFETPQTPQGMPGTGYYPTNSLVRPVVVTESLGRNGVTEAIASSPMAAPGDDPAAKLKAILRILGNSKFAPFSDRLRIFGSMAHGKSLPGDVDIMLDYSDRSAEALINGTLDGWLFLSLCQKYYGLVDVFVKTSVGLYVRNDRADGWVPAKFARKMIQQADRDGKTLAEIGAIWPPSQRGDMPISKATLAEDQPAAPALAEAIVPPEAPGGAPFSATRLRSRVCRPCRTATR